MIGVIISKEDIHPLDSLGFGKLIESDPLQYVNDNSSQYDVDQNTLDAMMDLSADYVSQQQQPSGESVTQLKGEVLYLRGRIEQLKKDNVELKDGFRKRVEQGIDFFSKKIDAATMIVNVVADQSKDENTKRILEELEIYEVFYS
jgi:hypothetical protein